MRLTSLLALAPLFAAAPVLAQEAQEPPPAVVASLAATAPKNTLTFNPIGLIFGMVNFEYERALTDKVSVFVGPKAIVFNAYRLHDDTSLLAVGVDVGARIFLTGSAPRGLWIGPSVGVTYASLDTDEREAVSVVGYDASVLFGHTWIWRSGFTLSLGIGAGYTDISAESGEERIGIRGPTVAGRASIGYAF